MRQFCQPAAKQGVNLFRPQLVADGLQPAVVLAGNESVIQRLASDPVFAQLALGIFVSVQAKLRVIGEVRTELQEEGAEVPVEAVDIKQYFKQVPEVREVGARTETTINNT